MLCFRWSTSHSNLSVDCKFLWTAHQGGLHAHSGEASCLKSSIVTMQLNCQKMHMVVKTKVVGAICPVSTGTCPDPPFFMPTYSTHATGLKTVLQSWNFPIALYDSPIWCLTFYSLVAPVCSVMWVSIVFACCIWPHLVMCFCCRPHHHYLCEITSTVWGSMHFYSMSTRCLHNLDMQSRWFRFVFVIAFLEMNAFAMLKPLPSTLSSTVLYMQRHF